MCKATGARKEAGGSNEQLGHPTLEKAEVQLMLFVFLFRHKSIRAYKPDYLSKLLQMVFI